MTSWIELRINSRRSEHGIAAWITILITRRYPRRLFTFVEGVMRWNNRVIGYAFTLITD